MIDDNGLSGIGMGILAVAINLSICNWILCDILKLLKAICEKLPDRDEPKLEITDK